MAKNIFQDMVQVKKARMKNDKKEEIFLSRRTNEPSGGFNRDKNIKNDKYITRRKPSNGIWFLAVVTLIALFFSISMLFTHAEVVINPEVREITLNEKFSAVKGTTSSNISFDLVILKDEEKREIQGGEKIILKKNARGTVVIFNSFSISSQTLDINTRLEGTNGKIYKTEKRLVVPGMSKDKTPGKIEVEIYAQEEGEEYNSAPMDFKIVGFKGSAKYDKFMVRSKGEISGGGISTERKVSEEQTTTLLPEMDLALKSKLSTKVKDKIHEDFILWKEASFIEVEKEVIQEGAQADTSEIVLRGTIYGFLFNKKEISNAILKKSIADYEDNSAFISNIDDITFTLEDKENITLQNVNSIKNINFSLSGKPRVVYQIETASIISELVNRSKNDFEKILSKNPHIKSADLTVRPIWKKSLPENKEDIEIIVNYQ